jgi:methyltransferase (TIGR00027 family)
MEQHSPSITALAAAFFRAYHYAYDAPWIFEDPYAQQLLTASDTERLTTAYIDLLHYAAPALAATCPDRRSALRCALQHLGAPAETLSRARYAEDKLTEAMRHGVQQYVILGAGLDTFAFRRPDLLPHLHVFEVDHPATQAFKRTRLAAAGLTPAPNVHFVAIDLAQESLATALSRTAYRPQVPTFWSWLAVVIFLQRDQVFASLQAIRNLAAPGSQLVFDYFHADSVRHPERQSPIFHRLCEYDQRIGEPVITGFDPATLGRELAQVGFRIQEDLAPEEINSRYFQGYNHDYRAWEVAHFVCADVM